MNIWIAIVFGIIQGITEFLPVSSSGHLLLFGAVVGTEPQTFFTLLLHLATMLTIILFYWNEITDCLKHPFSKHSICLLGATVCTALIAFSLAKLPFVSSAVALGPCFIATGILLVLSSLTPRRTRPYKNIGYASALTAGIAQGLCVLPGLSRLGTTVSTFKMFGMNTDEATKNSFLLAIPIVVGGIVLNLAKGIEKTSIGIVSCLAGFFAAFAVSCLSVLLLKKLIKLDKWWIFAPYLIAIGIATCIWQYA